MANNVIQQYKIMFGVRSPFFFILANIAAF